MPPTPSPPACAYLALGTNLGDRMGHLQAACGALGQHMQVQAASPVYQTRAVADTPQPDYLNAVVRVATVLGPMALLKCALEIEKSQGRFRPADQNKAPRTLDIDVLLYDRMILNETGLCLPHPGILQRAFVRIPLADVAAPGLLHPLNGEALDQAAPHSEVTLWPQALLF